MYRGVKPSSCLQPSDAHPPLPILLHTFSPAYAHAHIRHISAYARAHLVHTYFAPGIKDQRGHSSPMDAPSGHAITRRRRKTRKGTFSCWECKSRKRRCEFQAGFGDCVSCRQRGLECISQEYETGENSYGQVAERIGHVEGLVSRLLQQRRNGQGPISRDDAIESHGGVLTVPRQPSKASISISTYLQSVFPSPDNVAMILRGGNYSRMPTRVLWSGGRDPLCERDPPPPDAHPVWFAHRLMYLALCLQNAGGKRQSSSQYVDIVARHVTSLDVMITSAEGIEVLMLEAMYSVNEDHLQVAWLKCRRAIAVAQLVGIDQAREDPHAKSLWFRLLYGERIISLELGLPHSLLADDLLDIWDDQGRRLEKTHISVSGRIIKRNLRMKMKRTSREYNETMDIDCAMKEAMRRLPSSWWCIAPSLSAMTEDQAMIETAKLTSQMNHFWLIMNLYQPFVIDSLLISDDSSDALHMRLTLAMACYEMLTRFLVLRRYHNGTLYHGVDSKALSAAVALTLAHIAGHRYSHNRTNSLEHMRPQHLNSINETMSLVDDPAWAGMTKSAARALLDIEAEVAIGGTYAWWIGEGQDENIVALAIPYFGVLQGVQESISSNMASLE